jgi:hypothetical protein
MAGYKNKNDTDWEIINKKREIDEDMRGAVAILSDEEKNLPTKERYRAVKEHFKFLQDWRKEELKPWEEQSLADDRVGEEAKKVNEEIQKFSKEQRGEEYVRLNENGGITN